MQLLKQAATFGLGAILGWLLIGVVVVAIVMYRERGVAGLREALERKREESLRIANWDMRVLILFALLLGVLIWPSLISKK